MARDGVIIHIDGDDSGFRKALSGIGGVAQKGIAATVKGLAAIGTGFTAVTGAALKFSGDLEQNLGGSEAVFNEFADSIQKKADTAFKDMGLSASDYLATANKMGSLFKGAGFEIEESVDMTTAAMQRAADVASIMGIDTAWAMESIAGAAKGNFTMMDNLGVAMNDTTLNAYALEIGLGKTTAQMTNQEKVALAMEMFLDRTSYAAGNYAKENETLAGALGTAKAALQNFIAGTGDVDDIVDALSNATEVIIDNLGELLPKLVSGISGIVKKLIPMIPDIIGRLIPPIIEVFEELVRELAKIAPEIAEALIQGIEKAIPALKPLTSILKTLVSNFKAVAATVGSVVAVIALYNTTAALTKTLTTAWTAATATLNAMEKAHALTLVASNGGLTLYQTLVGLLTGKITLQTAATGAATAAQTALNVAMNANPIGVVLIAITALIAGIYALSKAVSGHASEEQKRAEELRKTNEELKVQQEESAKLREEREKSAASDLAQAEYVKSLKTELMSLADASGNVQAKDAARAQFILTELNTALGTEYAMTGNIISNYQHLQQEIDGLIAKKKLQILQDAMLPAYEEAVRSQVAETIAMTKAATEAENTRKEIEALRSKQALSQLPAEVIALQEQIENKEALLEELDEAERLHTENVKTNTDTITRYEEAQTLALQGNVQEAINCIALKNDALDEELAKVKGNKAEEERVIGDAYANALEQLALYTERYDAGTEGYTEEGLRLMQQHAEEMKTEAESVGINLIDGIVAGIDGYQQNVKDAVDRLAALIPEWAKKILGIQSPSRVMRDEVGKMITKGIAVGIDDGKTEVQKVLDEMNEELLESEQKYLDESERLKDSKSDADKKYLEELKEAADAERKIYDALQKDIENSKQAIVDNFTEMTDEAFAAMEDIEKAQKSIADKLNEDTTYSSYSIMENGEEQKHFVLGDGGKSAKELENYSNLIDRLFEERGDIPDEIMEFLSGMSMEEGTNYINAMLKATDEQFEAYISNLQKEAEYADKISKQLTSNDLKEVEALFTEEFGQVPEDFFNLGEESAAQYGEGFISQLKGMFAEVQAMMSSSMAAIGGQLALAGAGNITSTSYTDARTTTINVESDETGHNVFAALKAHEIYEEHTRKVGG